MQMCLGKVEREKRIDFKEILHYISYLSCLAKIYKERSCESSFEGGFIF